LVWENSARNQ